MGQHCALCIIVYHCVGISKESVRWHGLTANVDTVYNYIMHIGTFLASPIAAYSLQLPNLGRDTHQDLKNA